LSRRRVAELAGTGHLPTARGRPSRGPSYLRAGQSSVPAAHKRVLRSFLILAAVVVLVFVTMRSACSGVPVCVPDGEWADTTSVGIMSGRARIYADKFWRACSLRTCGYPYVDVFLQVDSVKIPANRKVYWYLLDPDDPAGDITVDPNGSLPNDNVLRGRLLSCQHPVIDSLSDTLVSTQLESGANIHQACGSTAGTG
jgi:hypothetical protein